MFSFFSGNVAVKTTAIFAFVLVLFSACAARAQAAAEFCPATIVALEPSGMETSTSTYSYQLRAFTERTVEATIIADTDHGWYSWNQAPTQLVARRYTIVSPTVHQLYWLAESAEVSVDFPGPVQIYRMWVMTARTQHETFFNWDNSGLVSCDPPDFKPQFVPGTMLQQTANAGDPTPPPAPAKAIAVRTEAPFPSLSCAQPFASATVTHAVSPDFPASAMLLSQTVSAEIYVAVGSDGKLTDAWVFATSGLPAVDASALLAARRSTYRAAISYCKPVGGLYLFRADFNPD